MLYAICAACDENLRRVAATSACAHSRQALAVERTESIPFRIYPWRKQALSLSHRLQGGGVVAAAPLVRRDRHWSTGRHGRCSSRLRNELLPFRQRSHCLLDRVVLILGGTAVAPFAARQPDVFLGVYLGLAMQILRNVILSCGDFLGFALRKEPKPLKLKDWLGGLEIPTRIVSSRG